jgi:SAM-dependent methyltransferase
LSVEPPWGTTEFVDRWRENAARRARALGPATERMLDAAGLQPGQRVLDMAAGSGDQTLLAARRVLPGGTVLAVDISPTMLEAAREAVREAGLSNVETLVGDGSQVGLPPASFDASISRMGLMFMPDLQRALGNVRAALVPGARFAALVWSLAERNPSMGIPIDVVRERRGLPSPPPPVLDAFSLSQPGAFERALVAAGFSDVHVEPVSVPRQYASLDESMAALTALADLLGRAPEEERAPLEAEVRRRFSAYARSDGSVELPGEAWLGSARC